jgi:glutaredoxin
VAHTESEGYYPGQGDYSPNSFSSFSAARRLEDLKTYWEKSPNDVVYKYRVKKDLVLVALPTLESLHDWLQEKTDMVGDVPYNSVENNSFPYERKDTYAWDYADMGLVCAVFGADGVVRHDEVVLCAPYDTKIDLVEVLVQPGGRPKRPATVEELQDMGMDIYYRPPPKIVRKMQSNKSVATVRRRIKAARGTNAAHGKPRMRFVLFSKTYCAFCAESKKLALQLTGRYGWEEPVVVELDERTDLQKRLAKHTGIRTVPQVFIQKAVSAGNFVSPVHNNMQTFLTHARLVGGNADFQKMAPN